MIQSDPTMISITMRTPKASASTLFALSGPVVMWMKKTRWMPIWAIASTTSAKRDARPPDQVGSGDEEGDAGDECRQEESDRVAQKAFHHLVAAGRLIPRCGVAVIENRIDVGLAHQPTPNR